MGKEHWTQHSYRAEHPLQAHPMTPLGSGSTTTTPVSPQQKGSAPNLAHTALIFQMLPEHLNFCTSISGPRPALINGPHLSRHHVARRPCPARQLCFRIMGALHPSPYHAMIVHLCDLSVKPLCQKGQQGTAQVEAIGTRGGGGGALRHDIYVQCVTGFLLLWLAVLTDKQKYFPADDAACLILLHMGAWSLGDIQSAINNVGRQSEATNGDSRFFSCMVAFSCL